MKFTSILKQSLTAIMANKVRSFLTILGIVIGIGSVIGMMSLGNGVKENIRQQIDTLGSRNLTIYSGVMSTQISDYSSMNSMQRQKSAVMNSGQTLTKKDLESLKKLSSNMISYVAGYVSEYAIIKYNNLEQGYSVRGVSADYYSLYGLDLKMGEYPKDNEVVLGSELANDLFGTLDPTGQKLTIQNTEFTVVGLLKAQEENSFNNPNSDAYISDAEAFTLFNTKNYTNIIVQASSEDMVDQAKQEIESSMLESHGIEDKASADFTVTSSKDLLSMVDSVMNIMTTFLASIAAISLLVGGIGIMNIMLVSVTERTREIGLRKALGASTSDILIQFMTEAVVLTLIGGILGILLGYGIGKIAGIFLEFEGIVTFQSILLAVGISSLIGIVFGIYPAARASKLNPIDALRYE